jgi:NADH-quinone oxidoreductase subunit J
MGIIHYFLTILLLIIATLIFISQNPVHSVLFLILSFFISAITLLTFGVEFLGLLFIMVYVGAVAVLFLFVVMMINTKKIIEKKTPFLRYFTFKILSIILFTQIDYFLNNAFFNDKNFNAISKEFNFSIIQFDHLTNIELLAQSLFNNFNMAILLAGLILLVALIGCICLTIPFKNVTKFNDQKQNSRSNQIHSFSRLSNLNKIQFYLIDKAKGI